MESVLAFVGVYADINLRVGSVHHELTSVVAYAGNGNVNVPSLL